MESSFKEILDRADEKRAVFIDELNNDGHHAYICTEDHKKLIEKLDYFWVAPRDKGQVSLFDRKDDLGLDSLGLTKFLLTRNMRNSKAVLKFTQLICPNPVQGLLPEVLKNFPKGKKIRFGTNPIKCITEASKSANKGILVIVGNVDLDQKIEFFSNLKDFCKKKDKKKLAAVQTSILVDYIEFFGRIESMGEKCIDFLEEKGNILFVSADCIAGFEWPTAVCIGQILDMNGAHTEHFVNVFLRSIAALYVSEEAIPYPWKICYDCNDIFNSSEDDRCTNCV